jgi:predicted metalloprotease
MRWKGREQSDNIEDRRGMTPGRMVAGGGIGTLLLVLAVSWLTGTNPIDVLNQLDGQSSVQTGPYVPTAEERELESFVRVTLKSTELIWTAQFQKAGLTYTLPTLVLFKDRVQTGAGTASAAMGPFYLDSDQKLYIDLGFYSVLRDKLGAKGDFAQAYVIAHEVGHHVQNLLGTLGRIHALQQTADETTRNHLSVRLELQADFYAGVWAHYEQQQFQSLDESDIRSAMDACAAIGDDVLQRKFQGSVVPDSFTHGTAEQRTRWFLKGWKTGDIHQGDTFTINYRDL